MMLLLVWLVIAVMLALAATYAESRWGFVTKYVEVGASVEAYSLLYAISFAWPFSIPILAVIAAFHFAWHYGKQHKKNTA